MTTALHRACRRHRELFAAHLHRRLPPTQTSRLRYHLDQCPPCWSDWNVYRWRRAMGTPLGHDLRAFLGKQFIPHYDSSAALATAWQAAAPTTPVERAAFFRASTDYLYNSTIWTASGHRPPYLRQAAPFLERLSVRTILDYGCGIGADTLALHRLGYGVTACDYHSPSTRFLLWRAERQRVRVHICEPDAIQLPRDTHVLWIIDTLDHLPNPDEALQPALAQVRVVITEDLRDSKAHGEQGFHPAIPPATWPPSSPSTGSHRYPGRRAPPPSRSGDDCHERLRSPRSHAPPGLRPPGTAVEDAARNPQTGWRDTVE